MSADETLDLRVFLFAENRNEVRELARAFLEATRAAAPTGVSVRGHRLYRGLPRGFQESLAATVEAFLEEAA